jgi:hypothetical protein
MKNLILLLIISYFSTSVQAQSWSAVGNSVFTGPVWEGMGIHNGELYVGGNHSINTTGVLKWDCEKTYRPLFIANGLTPKL